MNTDLVVPKTGVFILSESVPSWLEEQVGSLRRDYCFNKFPSGEFLLEPTDSVRGQRVFIVQDFRKSFSDAVMATLILADALRRASACHISLVVVGWKATSSLSRVFYGTLFAGAGIRCVLKRSQIPNEVFYPCRCINYKKEQLRVCIDAFN